MAGISKANIRKIVRTYFSWRTPVLVATVVAGGALLLAGLFFLHQQISTPPQRDKLTPATKIDLTDKPIIKKDTYRIKSGDNLWHLAKLYYGDGLLYQQLAAYNHLANPSNLRVGQEIKIPKISELTSTDSMVQKISQKRINQSALPVKTYQVMPDDCLWTIAQKEMGNPYLWTKIYSKNANLIGADPNLILPGQILLL